MFSDAAAGKGVLLLLLLSAFAWGAIHALSPGHGKAMVAAYLVGTRGTPRHAVALGAIVTVTHTIGVFALGAVALLLSQYILPETCTRGSTSSPARSCSWSARRSCARAIRWARARGATSTITHHHHHHARPRTHDHAHDHGLVHSHDGGKPHSHAPPETFSWKGLLAMGASAGLIPCPSALVVLLGAIAQGQIALGMLLIVAFSVGLAATLTLLGLAVVFAGKALSRMPVPGRLTLALPTVSRC